MPYQPYQDAGSAFSGGMESFLLDRATAERQARLDAQAARAAEDRHLEAEAALQEKKTENLAKLEDKERAQVEKEVTGMVPGDIPDASLIARARKYHIPLRTGIDLKQDGPKMPTRVVQEMGGQAPVEAPVTPAPIRFAGSPKQVDAARAEDEQAVAVAALPKDSVAAQVAQARAAGIPLTGADVRGPVVTDTSDQKNFAAAVKSGYKGNFVQFLKDKANFKNPSTGNNEARENTRRDNNYRSAVSELEKTAQPLADHVKNIDDLGIMLNERTPAADAHIAPMVLKAVVGGQGSGFRITQAEIAQVVGGRSKWQDLEAKLNKWSTDPSQALTITDEQRTELRSLAKAIRKKAQDKLQRVARVRHELDDAPDVDTIHRTMTKLKEDLYAGDDEPKVSAADLIAKYSKPK